VCQLGCDWEGTGKQRMDYQRTGALMFTHRQFEHCSQA
jgi:hypothetical protein